jgi:hypothetical protein
LLPLMLACRSGTSHDNTGSYVHLLRVSAGEYVESSIGRSGDDDSDFARVNLLRFTALMVEDWRALALNRCIGQINGSVDDNYLRENACSRRVK